MQGRSVITFVLIIVGVYFLVFHTKPLPFSHNEIGLPPLHVIHAIFGIALLAGAVYLLKRNKSA